MRFAGVTEDELEAACLQERSELQRRQRLYRDDPRSDRDRGAPPIVVAVPTASEQTCAELDAIVRARTPANFMAGG